MGRLPSTYANRAILDRYAFVISGDKIVTTGQLAQQYPDSTFLNAGDKPFEVHRFIPRIYALDASNVLLPTQPDQELLAGLIKLKIVDMALNQDITKGATIVGSLTKGSAERTWELADPHYLPKASQLQVTIDAYTFPAIDNLASLRVVLTLQGFLLQVAPPSMDR